jgi:hypothetical protein
MNRKRNKPRDHAGQSEQGSVDLARCASVRVGNRDIGFIYLRPDGYFEAIDALERSLGLYDDEAGAVVSVARSMADVYEEEKYSGS